MTVRCINTNAAYGLKGIPGDSIDCVVTSPPYWGLRAYGTGSWGMAATLIAITVLLRCAKTGRKTARSSRGRPQPAVHSFLIIIVHAAANAARCAVMSKSGLSLRSSGSRP